MHDEERRVSTEYSNMMADVETEMSLQWQKTARGACEEEQPPTPTAVTGIHISFHSLSCTGQHTNDYSKECMIRSFDKAIILRVRFRSCLRS